jgi:alkylation response protein AidB-like acyl-CoA dehydrogenase
MLLPLYYVCEQFFSVLGLEKFYSNEELKENILYKVNHWRIIGAFCLSETGRRLGSDATSQKNDSNR